MTSKLRYVDPSAAQTAAEATPPAPSREEILGNERSFLDALIATQRGRTNRRRALVVHRDDPTGAVDPETGRVRRVPTLKVVLRDVSEKEVARCNELATDYEFDKATKVKKQKRFDDDRFACAVIAAATVGLGSPDADEPTGAWDDAAVLRSFDAMEAHEAVMRVLTPLERASFLKHVEDLSGYGTFDPVEQADLGKP